VTTTIKLPEKKKKKLYAQDIKDRLISIFIGIFAILWIFPILWTLWSSLRPYKGSVFSIMKMQSLAWSCQPTSITPL
jgi:ABC-type glycerol-3-phosphate transport system permease component